MLELAIRAAREAGELLRTNLDRRIEIVHKGAIDLVTEVDLASERLIKELILTHYPRHAFLGEEGGQTGGGEYRWIIDPLDGTTNYAHRYPCFCVSVALERAGEVILGVVYEPMRDELFAAERGAGATLNSRTIRVSGTAPLREALLCTGFPYDLTVEPGASNFEMYRKFSLAGQAVRRDGSAALDLAYLACGRFDGFWEMGLNPWDTAAGALLVAEAGGRLTGFRGGAFDPFFPEIVASNGRIHDEMLAVLASGPSGLFAR